jgi:hypothetical protein
MNDGSWTGAGIILHTNSFSKSETTGLAKMLTSKFGIITSLQSKGNAYLIYIHSVSVLKVRELTMQYILLSFRYKLGITDLSTYRRPR